MAQFVDMAGMSDNEEHQREADRHADSFGSLKDNEMQDLTPNETQGLTASTNNESKGFVRKLHNNWKTITCITLFILLVGFIVALVFKQTDIKVIEVESLGAPIGPVKEGKTTATTTAATTTAATTTVATTAATTTAATTAATTTAATTTAATTAVAGVVPTKAADLPSGGGGTRTIKRLYAHLEPYKDQTDSRGYIEWEFHSESTWTSHGFNVRDDNRSLIRFDTNGVYNVAITMCICCYKKCSLNKRVRLSLYQNGCRIKNLYKFHAGSLTGSILVRVQKEDYIRVQLQKNLWYQKTALERGANSIDISLYSEHVLEPIDQCVHGRRSKQYKYK